MTTQINIAKLSNNFKLWKNCHETNTFWRTKWKASINQQLEHLPSGSGLDLVGIKFDWNNSTPECLRFKFPFRHSDENGNYDGWTHHELLIQPSLSQGFNLDITGEDRNGILNYFYDLFYNTFYYKADYHKFEEESGKQQPLGLYQRLENYLARITINLPQLKKQPAKS